MRIGVDFDNTIVCYDGAFQRGARDLGLVSEDLFASKNAVRDYFNNAGRRDEFTALQGYVYGARVRYPNHEIAYEFGYVEDGVFHAYPKDPEGFGYIAETL